MVEFFFCFCIEECKSIFCRVVLDVKKSLKEKGKGKKSEGE